MLPEARGTLNFYKNQLNNGKLRLVTENIFGGTYRQFSVFARERPVRLHLNGVGGMSFASEEPGIFKRYDCPGGL